MPISRKVAYQEVSITESQIVAAVNKLAQSNCGESVNRMAQQESLDLHRFKSFGHVR